MGLLYTSSNGKIMTAPIHTKAIAQTKMGLAHIEDLWKAQAEVQAGCRVIKTRLKSHHKGREIWPHKIQQAVIELQSSLRFLEEKARALFPARVPTRLQVVWEQKFFNITHRLDENVQMLHNTAPGMDPIYYTIGKLDEILAPLQNFKFTEDQLTGRNSGPAKYEPEMWRRWQCKINDELNNFE
ncbi:hypothetical protein N7462_000427 [Penicillium macrosclerotiorum]|uniref:uncharacterized protein n=1 Tax=Penicillium macrosclerotiorum TaxID=303699 RepID=UPI0025486ADD|nr:uncharacterized protein N7462_000427 [Penicillium macrosclerotiorum]KAJ5698422.1 hypothetical protein N7462_000427 [Penicillium macrosclerotiorum]